MDRDIPSIVGYPPISGVGNAVVVDGRVMPKMRCRDIGDDKIDIIIDGRMSFTFPKEWAYLAAAMSGQAMAIGSGYTHIGALSKKNRCFAPKIQKEDKVDLFLWPSELLMDGRIFWTEIKDADVLP